MLPAWQERLHENELFRAAADALFKSPLVDRAAYVRRVGYDALTGEEFVDVFSLLAREAQAQILPTFDSAFYADSAGREEVGGAPLSHFLAIGLGRGLSPHPLIDLEYMARLRRDLAAGDWTMGKLAAMLTLNLVDPSPFFSNRRYVRLTGAADAAAGGPLLHHFLTTQGAAGSPIAFYDDEVYGAERPGAGDTLAERLVHFVTLGDGEASKAGRLFDAAYYLAAYPDVPASGRPPLNHYLAIGRFEGRSPRPGFRAGSPHGGADGSAHGVEDPPAILERDKRVRRRIAQRRRERQEAFQERNALPFHITDHDAALRSLRFDPPAEPAIDILVPCFNEFDLTVECLTALQAALGGVSARVILVDDASTDPRMQGIEAVEGLVYARNAVNLHFLRSCNRAYEDLVTAPYVLLLNNDTQVLGDAISRLYAEIVSDPAIGAVGPKILYPNGRLQEAGCELLADATSRMIGVGGDADAPQYGWRREVGYVSGACLLVRREAVGPQLFDERFAPAYCEDSDMCMRLRSEGWKTVYLPEAGVIHHLSVSTSRTSQQNRLRRVAVNQQKFQEKWGAELQDLARVRTIAFYLPQFHAIAENDLWWGKGFTEWTNVAKCRPAYAGQHQPRLPADLGFYDLLRPEVMASQYALASRYGVSGFAMYYYNFGGHRMLHRPLENLLERPDLDFSFCLCWANENWTRHWDGGIRSILLEQKYDDETLAAICKDVVRTAKDRRAIRVNGKPVFLIYRPLLLPDPEAFGHRMRRAFAEAGEPGVYLMYVESMEAINSHLKPEDIGFDACVEFPPQGIGVLYDKPLKVTNPAWAGDVYDYEASTIDSLTRPGVAYKRHPCVFPNWDNTARQPLAGVSFVGSEPEIFEIQVQDKLENVASLFVGEERLLFVNAWNEWAEGTYLEPDRSYGHRWLAALERGRVRAVGS